ncbi:MAG: radical SAM protein, partial [bacterium]|nr:radical SAM protein [bacterium]
NSFKDKSNPIWVEIKNTIRDYQPDIVGISIWTTYAAAAFYVAKICKELNPNCSVVMGGPHATVNAEEILNICPSVDYIVRNEGEITLPELVRYIQGENPNILSISGISFRQDNQIIHIPCQDVIRDLDIFPFPDRTLLTNEKKYTSEDMGLILTSRGCPYNCTYCATPSKLVRYRSLDSVLQEIQFVNKRYGTTQFSFKDDSFTLNHRRVLELCEQIKQKKLDIKWECNTRVNLINEELLKKMKQAGCNSIKVGIESGSQRMLEKMNKGITFEQVRNAANLFRKIGVYWTGYFMIGVPGETIEDIYHTLQFMNEVKPDFASVCVYEPFPGTIMFDEGIKRGLVLPNMTLEQFYTIIPNHYYKKDVHRQVDTIEEPEFIALEKEIKTAFHKYNKSYRQVLKRVKSRARIYLREPSILVGDIRKYLTWR